uniref:Tudor domain-containing protein n=1 Tax=Parastrongyloides trichosuri TaxID=131310 RepID=A0A0N4ZUL5_PARTI
MWNPNSPFFYYPNPGFLIPFHVPLQLPKIPSINSSIIKNINNNSQEKSGKLSPALAFLQQPQRFEFDEKDRDITNLSEPDVDFTEILQALYNEGRVITGNQHQEKHDHIKVKAPEVPTVEDKQIPDEDIFKIIEEYKAFKELRNKNPELIPEHQISAMLYNFPGRTINKPYIPGGNKSVSDDFLIGNERIFINGQNVNHLFKYNNMYHREKFNNNKKFSIDDDTFYPEKEVFSSEEPSRQSRSEIQEKPFWNTMDRPGSPIRKMIISKFQMPRKNIQTSFIEVEYLSAVSPSFIYFREIHHVTNDYEITKPSKLKDLFANTKLSIGSHGYSITLPSNGDCITWRYCMAPIRPDHLVRARIIDRKPMIRSCEDKDPNNEYYKVFYIDHGTTNWVKKRVCFEMPSEEWFTKPPEALPISLYNILPKSSLFGDPNMKTEWSQNVCVALRHILEEYKYFEVHIKNYLAIKKRSDQTYAADVICYSHNPKVYPEFHGTGKNLSQLLANKCMDDIIMIDGINADADIPKFETSCRFDRNTFNLPDHLSHRSSKIYREQLSSISNDSKICNNSVAMLQHNSLDPQLLTSPSFVPKPRYPIVEKKVSIRIPIIDVPEEVWPCKGLPWTPELLVSEGFIKDDFVFFSYTCRSINPDCFNFSAQPIHYEKMKNILKGCGSFSKYQFDIMEAKKKLDESLLTFYSNPDNRRIFSWEYIRSKLQENEVINCIVGMLDNSDDDRYKCHRARILSIIEDFADELKGIEKKPEEGKPIDYVILELYDYGGVMAVSIDSICQIHPIHESISPFTIRLCMNYNINQMKSNKFKDLVKISPKWVRDLKKNLTEVICSAEPHRARIVRKPSTDNTYKFEYYINPIKDDSSYKIVDVQKASHLDEIPGDRNILCHNKYYKRFCEHKGIDIFSKFSKTLPNVEHDQETPIEKLQSNFTSLKHYISGKNIIFKRTPDVLSLTFQEGFCHIDRPENEYNKKSSIIDIWIEERSCNMNNILYENNNEINKSSLVISLIREPIDRFIESYIHVCWRQYNILNIKNACFNCHQKLDCFISKINNYLNHFQLGHHIEKHDVETYKYFIPQIWIFNKTTTNYKFINLTSNKEKKIEEEYKSILNYLSLDKEIQNALIMKLKKSIKIYKENNEIRNSKKFYMDELINDSTLINQLICMYYNDFIYFNFQVPKIDVKCIS